ncbi:hypothetical protein [Malaciobacter marinus]|uniref:hypothetical protein n=1 Tax=Malaciobacter marinus TaxID=505249 RepID=UPI001055408F|nr:hypothetical protein [Malaciobacter marinus]
MNFICIRSMYKSYKNYIFNFNPNLFSYSFVISASLSASIHPETYLTFEESIFNSSAKFEIVNLFSTFVFSCTFTSYQFLQ